MMKEDVAEVHSLLHSHLCKFHLSPIFSEQEVEHWLLPRENVIDTYVVEVWPYNFSTPVSLSSEKFQNVPETDLFPCMQKSDGTLTDVVSFHSTSYKVLNHPVHTGLKAAILLYAVSTTTDPVDLMEDTLVLAKSVSVSMY